MSTSPGSRNFPVRSMTRTPGRLNPVARSMAATLAAHRADDAFDVGILPGRARCRADGRETEGLDRPTERRVEGRVAVVEEEPRVRVVGKGLAELLSGPCGRWVRRHIDMQDASPVVGQDNEDE